MLFRQKFLDGIRDGTITLAFRRWRRPSVRAGGTLLTAVGQLEIASVEEVAMSRITDGDARRPLSSRRSGVAPFKINMRKLKTLGLTESLEVGYRLSPRGTAFMDSDGH